MFDSQEAALAGSGLGRKWLWLLGWELYSLPEKIVRDGGGSTTPTPT
jgi:hypothetical protein